MNASEKEKNKCKRCGAVIPENSTEKLCPACLMSGAMKLSCGGAETVSMAWGGPLSLYGPSEFPCEFDGYRLLGLLGRGGMGTVYEAEHIATGRRIALKMLGQQLDSPEMRQRFLREGRLAAGINHPNSLYIFGSEEIDGMPVITMEIAGSGTLKDKLKKRGPLPITEAVDAILDVISGLESAYAAGVLHRDIKPSNCFISPDGSVKVGDFGLSVSTLAKADTFVTVQGKIMGTPAFASPEQLRGDNLDLRADIYSVGATLYTLLTNEVPFEGDNVVQIVANAVNKKPKPLTELRHEISPGLEKVVARCLAKEPQHRYADYSSLRNALLPFSSKESEPASIKVRVSAGWIDYLIAFMVPYIALMLLVGPIELLIKPVTEHTLYSMRYYLLLFGLGFLYFAIVEGLWGAGLGKRLKGLCVVRKNGRRPGIVRALIRIMIPIACIEVVRMPISIALFSSIDMTVFQIILFIVIANVCAWLPVLLTLSARRENNFVTIWDIVSGTRVIVKPKGTVRPTIKPLTLPEISDESADRLGPYKIIKDIIPQKWIAAHDPVLRRQVWLLKRNLSEFSTARQNVARIGRLRWLQKVETDDAIWDAFEATEGVPFSTLIEDGKKLSWTNLRYWLYDLSSELWNSTRDGTLPSELSLDHVWITKHGHVVLLDEPWPEVKTRSECISVKDLAGQQRFLNAIASCVEATSLPLHARAILRNLEEGKFEKLSFLTGNLSGLLNKPAEVSRGIKIGSIFMLPLYVWILVFVGYYQGIKNQQWDYPVNKLIMISAMAVLGIIALVQLLELPFRNTASHSIFRLAVINVKGERATISNYLLRWAIVWVPIFVPMTFVALLIQKAELVPAFILFLISLMLWLGAAVYAVVYPNQGLHDRLAGNWIVRR